MRLGARAFPVTGVGGTVRASGAGARWSAPGGTMPATALLPRLYSLAPGPSPGDNRPAPAASLPACGRALLLPPGRRHLSVGNGTHGVSVYRHPNTALDGDDCDPHN